jgi:hypothetical protein
MIGIRKITGGRFGNRVLQYNNLVQLANKFEVPFYCDSWEGDSWLNLPEQDCKDDGTQPVNLTWSHFHQFDDNKLKDIIQNNHCVIDGNVIHNCFFRIVHQDPRKFLSIRPKLQTKNITGTNVGIHIRGDDIIFADGNNGREVHSFEFYKNSIDYILNTDTIKSFYVCTDDTNFLVYRKTIDYLASLNVKFEAGPSTLNRSISHIHDFILLSNCDYLISSSSTYVISAGFIGKNKKIIHSKEWIDKNVPGDSYVKWGRYTPDYPESYWKSYDKFWLESAERMNNFYKPWKII